MIIDLNIPAVTVENVSLLMAWIVTAWTAWQELKHRRSKQDLYEIHKKIDPKGAEQQQKPKKKFHIGFLEK